MRRSTPAWAATRHVGNGQAEASSVTLFTFGCGSFGELGVARADDPRRRDAATVLFPPSAPRDRAGEPLIEAIALGTDHSLAVVGSRVYRWGLLGAHAAPRPWKGDSPCPAPEVVPTPAELSGLEGGCLQDKDAAEEDAPPQPCPVRVVASGGSNSFMLTREGEVLLLGGLWPPGGDPSRVRHLWGAARGGSASRVAKVAAGWRHCLLLTQAGRLFALGDDEHGQCAGVNNGTAAVPLPTPHPVVGIAAGACHSATWDSVGSTFTWGHGGNGRLGLGHSQHCRSPSAVKVLGDERICGVDCGANFTLFTTAAFRGLWSCGSNRYGQLGLGTTEYSMSEVPVRMNFPPSGQELVSVRCGANHALCITRGLSAEERPMVWAWGCASSGQCGRAEDEPRGAAPPPLRSTPERLADFLAPAAQWAVAVAAGRSHSAVLARAGPYTSPTAAVFPSQPGSRAGSRANSPTRISPASAHLSPGRVRVSNGRTRVSPRQTRGSPGTRSFPVLTSKSPGARQAAQPPAEGKQDDIIDDFLGGLLGGASPDGAPSPLTRRGPGGAGAGSPVC